MTHEAIKPYNWNSEENGLDYISDLNGKVLGKLSLKRDIDGDPHWGFTIDGQFVAAKTRQLAKEKLERAIVNMYFIQ